MTTDSDFECSYVANLADFNVIIVIVIKIIVMRVIVIVVITIRVIIVYHRNKSNYSNNNRVELIIYFSINLLHE